MIHSIQSTYNCSSVCILYIHMHIDGKKKQINLIQNDLYAMRLGIKWSTNRADLLFFFHQSIQITIIYRLAIFLFVPNFSSALDYHLIIIIIWCLVYISISDYNLSKRFDCNLLRPPLSLLFNNQLKIKLQFIRIRMVSGSGPGDASTIK